MYYFHMWKICFLMLSIMFLNPFKQQINHFEISFKRGTKQCNKVELMFKNCTSGPSVTT